MENLSDLPKIAQPRARALDLDCPGHGHSLGEAAPWEACSSLRAWGNPAPVTRCVAFRELCNLSMPNYLICQARGWQQHLGSVNSGVGLWPPCAGEGGSLCELKATRDGPGEATAQEWSQQKD